MSPACRHTCSSQPAQIGREFAPLLSIWCHRRDMSCSCLWCCCCSSCQHINHNQCVNIYGCLLAVSRGVAMASLPNACLVSRSLNTLTERAASLLGCHPSLNCSSPKTCWMTCPSHRLFIHSFIQLSSQPFIHESAGNDAGLLVWFWLFLHILKLNW